MKIAAAFAVLALAGSAMASIANINGFAVTARNFNDIDISSVSVNGVFYNAPNPNPPPATLSNQLGAIAGLGAGVHFHETVPQFVPSNGGFANRHNAMFSTDGGATAYQFQRNEGFYIQTSVQVTGNNAPAKEAGLNFWMNRSVVDPGPVAVTYTDEGFFNIRNSDGEVAIFGGGLPFHSFGNVYVNGSTVTIGLAYYAPGSIAANGAVEYFYNGVGSGIKFMDNVNDRIIPGDVNSPTFGAGGISNYALIGFRAQNTRNPFLTEDTHTIYSNVSVIPAPGAAGLIGLAGLAAMRRRRA